MPPIEAPLNTANQHAANADDHMAQGLLIPAAEEHFKAAEAYTAAIERCKDDHTKRTLRMLHADHLRAGKELQRKIEALRVENKDPSLPQKPSPSPVVSNVNALSQTPLIEPVPSPPPSTRRMTDSQNTGEESFMVLGHRSDPGDAFNQFWKILEGMVENLSQPVAFATAPLAVDELQPNSVDALQRKGSLSSDTDLEEPMVRRITRRIGIGRDNSKVKKSSGLSQSQSPASFNVDDEEFDDGDFETGDDLSESFFVIPQGPEVAAANTRKENAMLKADVEALQMRLAAADRALQLRKDQDQQLRDSIFLARREAQRAMGASGMLQPRPGQGVVEFPGVNIVPPHSPIPPLNAGRDHEAQLLRRVRELEEENRALRANAEKQKATIAKYRERWDKVKESQKRKKAAAASTGVRDTINEEPEEKEQETTSLLAAKETPSNGDM